MTLTLVFARDRRDFEDWCWDNQISPRSPEVRYVWKADHLRALGQPVRLVQTGRFSNRDDAEHLWEMALHVQERQDSSGP